MRRLRAGVTRRARVGLADEFADEGGGEGDGEGDAADEEDGEVYALEGMEYEREGTRVGEADKVGGGGGEAEGKDGSEDDGALGHLFLLV